ncbi:hypothetical protein ACQCQS_25400, partial [Ralstonia pseudosolanacearum]
MPPRPSTGPDTHRPRALRQPAVLLWLLGLLACVAVIVRASFVADLSAFLPSSPSAEQRVLVDQLRDGLVSRLMLVAIEGGEPPLRARRLLTSPGCNAPGASSRH